MRGTTVEHLLLPGDVARAAVAVSVVVGAAALGGLAAALFLLVLGGALVPRLLGLPAVLDVCFGSCLDTVGDLAFGLLGALAVGVVLAVRRPGQGAHDAR